MVGFEVPECSRHVEASFPRFSIIFQKVITLIYPAQRAFARSVGPVGPDKSCRTVGQTAAGMPSLQASNRRLGRIEDPADCMTTVRRIAEWKVTYGNKMSIYIKFNYSFI